MDKSNGKDEIAERFIAERNPSMGVAIVRSWSGTLAEDQSSLDLGCGHGEPVARILMARGCRVFGVDASLRLLEEFRRRGREEYRRILENARLSLDGERSDEGENHYYFASKGVHESM
jgi:SAM-dependent methyltransferase